MTNPTDSELNTLEAAFFAAQDHMHVNNCPRTRRIYQDASRAYNGALDDAEQDPTRNWTR